MNVKKARFVFLVLPALVVVLLLSSVLVYLFLQGDYIAEQVRLNVVKQAEDSYSIGLKIEDAVLVGTSAIVFRNVTMDLQPDSAISNGIKTMTTPELVVHFNIFDILRGPEKVLESLRGITLKNPHVIFRTDVIGISNVDISESNVSVEKVDYPFAPKPVQLLPDLSDTVESPNDKNESTTSSSTHGLPGIVIPDGFAMKIRIINGTSEWLANTTDGLVRIETFENINGTIGVATDMPLDIYLEANAMGAKEASMRLFGLIQLFDQGLSDIQVDFHGVEIYYLQRKGLNLSSYIWFTQGLMDGIVNMNGSFEQGFNFRGSAKLQDGVGEYTLFDGVFEDVDADLDFATRSVNIKVLTATLDGVPVALSGRISNFSDPYFDLSVISETRGLKYLKPLASGWDGEFPVQGTGEITSRIEGTIGNLKISGNSRLEHGRVFGYETSELLADYVFQGQNAELTSITGEAYGGDISGKAVFDMTGENLNYLVELDAFGMEASDIAEVLGISAFAGSCTGELSGGIMIRTDATGVPVITGSVAIDDGALQGYNFEKVELGFWRVDKSTKVDYFTLKDGDSRLHARGLFDDETGFDLDVTAEKLEIDRFLRALGFDSVQMQGTTDFVGKMSGAMTSPELSGTLRISDGSIFGQSFSELLGKIAFAGDRFDIQDTSIYKGSMVHRVSGTVMLGESQNVNLQIVTEQATVSDLLNLGQIALDMSGEMSGAFSIAGPINNLTTEGNVSIVKGQLLGQRLDDAELQFKLEGKKFFFRRFSGLLNGSRVELSGLLDDARMDLSYRVEEFQPQNVSPIMHNNALHIAANMDVDGKIQGYLSEPVISGVFTAGRALINEAEFDSLRGKFLYSGNVLAFSSCDFLTDSGKYAVDGTLSLNGSDISSIDLKVKLDHVGIGNLVRLLGAQDSTVWSSLDSATGYLSGQIEVYGPSQDITGEAVLYSPEVHYGDTTFENMFLSGTLQGGMVDISTMRLLVGGGHLDLSGSIGLDGSIAFRATGSELPLNMIGRLVGLKHDLKGSINMGITAEGTISQPTVVCSFEAAKGSIEKVEFDSLSGSVLFEEYGFYLSDIVGRHNGNVAEIVGFVPFAIGARESVYTLGGLDLFIKMKEVDMGLMTLLASELEWCKGRMDAFIHLTGTLSSPVPNGYVTIRNGEAKFVSLRDPITSINGSVIAEQGVIELNRISGMLGQAGVFQVGGKATLTGLGLEAVDLNVFGSKVKVFTSEFEGYVDGSASVKGSRQDLSLIADLKLYDGTVTITTPEIEVGDFPVNPNLDVRVSVDKSISLRGAGIDVPIYGHLQVNGKLNDVSVRGRIDANKGDVSLFGTSFVLEEGAAEFYDLVGYIPRINLRARTRVGGAAVFLHVSGRADDLQIYLTSDPPRTTEEILALLSWPGAISRVLKGEVEEAIQDQIIDYVDSQIQQRVLRSLSSAVENAFQLDEFAIKTQLGRIIEVEIGKNIADNTYLNYVRSVDGADVKENLGIEITIHPNFLLTGGISREGEVRVGFEAKFEF